jgi:hypothetical protein
MALTPGDIFHSHCHENLRSHAIQEILILFSLKTVTIPFLPLNKKKVNVFKTTVLSFVYVHMKCDLLLLKEEVNYEWLKTKCS